MSTLPASLFDNVIPSVLSAGGNALQMNGMCLTMNTRIPIGTVQQFPNDGGAAISAYFGAAAAEVQTASVYFLGFSTSTQKPSTLLMTQYPLEAVAAYMRGGNITTLTLPQLQALTGTLIVVVDGYPRTAASFSLSSATSYSAGAALIQAALNATEPTEASVTGSIAPSTASFTASIYSDVLNVTAVASGSVVAGAIISGTGVTAGTQITSQLTGVAGGIGTYALTLAQTVPSGTISSTYGTLTVTAVSTGTISVGQAITGTGVTAGTYVTALGTGSGLTGTYFVTPTQTVASGTLVAQPVPLVVSFDSVSGGYLIQSGITGPVSTMAYATGTLSTSLLLTQATGAVLSQGAAAAVPASFMTTLTQNYTNWATFFTNFDPDQGAGNIEKQAFAAWTNSTLNRYAYLCWDSDITPTLAVPATTSLGYILGQINSSGTSLIYEPVYQNTAAMIAGFAASIDFGALNGRITFAYKGQTGFPANVTNSAIFTNLCGSPQVAGNYGNGYNAYVAIATASQTFLNFQRGTVTGPFLWLDSYINQIWLNNGLQQVIMILLTTVNSIPYNAAGYALIVGAISGQGGPVQAALTFGAIRTGVTLSSVQIAQVNTATGVIAAPILSQQGWYLQVTDAAPQVRQGRASPPCKFWYVDGQSVQAITLASINVQ